MFLWSSKIIQAIHDVWTLWALKPKSGSSSVHTNMANKSDSDWDELSAIRFTFFLLDVSLINAVLASAVSMSRWAVVPSSFCFLIMELMKDLFYNPVIFSTPLSLTSVESFLAFMVSLAWWQPSLLSVGLMSRCFIYIIWHLNRSQVTYWTMWLLKAKQWDWIRLCRMHQFLVLNYFKHVFNVYFRRIAAFTSIMFQVEEQQNRQIIKRDEKCCH